ncbi:MAG: helix-turn-helix domain-containing protein [Rhodothermus sp.]|nr:helix-turn-helix domain-containing protein [Rhodothermus sp.]
MMVRLLPLKEVQQRLNVCRTTLWKLRKSGQLPSVQIGRRVLIDERDLDRFIQQTKAAQLRS